MNDEPRWSASIRAFEGPDGIVNVLIRTEGDSEADALRGAVALTNLIAGGKTCFPRVHPRANSETDFETKKTYHTGLSRFAVKDEPGVNHSYDVEFVAGFGAKMVVVK